MEALRSFPPRCMEPERRQAIPGAALRYSAIPRICRASPGLTRKHLQLDAKRGAEHL